MSRRRETALVLTGPRVGRPLAALRRHSLALLLLAALLFPLVADPYALDVGITVLTFAMLGIGLNIVVGYAGLLDLGYAAFFAIGAYTSALLSLHLHVGFWEGLPLCILAAAASGAIIGYPTLRLRSDYLAIVTLGFGEIVRITATNLTGLTGGPNGLYGLPVPKIGNFELTSQRSLYLLGFAFLLVSLGFSWALSHSRLGRAWNSVREDETAAEAAGIPTVRVKLLAYVLGAVVAGLAGPFFAARFGAIDPTSFTFLQSVTILTVVVVGGMGSLPGMLVGAVVVQGLPELLRAVARWRLLAFAFALVLLMQFRPQGLWPVPQLRRDPFAGLPEEPNAQAPPAAAPQGEVLLHVHGLVKRFGGVAAVDQVSFEVRRGEILSIIGPNGAGKTTVFNCVTGLIRSNRGEVRLAGRPLRRLRPHQVVSLGMARTFQGIRLFKGMSVYENVMVGAYPTQLGGLWRGITHLHLRRETDLRNRLHARRWLRFVGLEDKAARLASELAYGEQRRLEIARALASEPQLLLLDEPGAGTNPSEKNDLMELIRRARGEGVTVLLIEHDMRLVMGISDRVVVMDQGHVLTEGTPVEVQRDERVIEAYLGREDESGWEIEEEVATRPS